MWLEKFRLWYNFSEMKVKNGDKLYQKYGKPLEEKHWGEYIAVSKNGRTVLSNDLIKVMKKSLADFGPGSHVFKIGERAVFKWRRIKQ